MLKHKRVLLGVTGGIAAYKSAELVRALVKREASVKVVMTKSAMEFVTPLTLQTLSGNPVYTELFTLVREADIAHVALAEEAQIAVVAPATANVIGKLASGIADDLLGAVLMATKAPVLVCPAMNTGMYENRIVQENMEKLRRCGYAFVEPASGELACKSVGVGRLPEIEDIVEEMESLLTPKDLAGCKILVTAGPTREPMDPVRFITNLSSGKMGYALARMAGRRGADVTLVSGPSALAPPRGVRVVSVSSAVQMYDAVMERYADADVVIKAAAVADYRPAEPSGSKIKKGKGPLTLRLERNPDIIAELGKKKGGRFLVGFAMETEDLLERARQKMEDKNMDLIVANDLSRKDAGFEGDTNVISILDREGGLQDLPLMDKKDAADRILDRISAYVRP
ncbi:MAG: bifunctional phosphopantothenoylcysteine decarboxylase/phosphopantothenate--cysteine ligase CoaBC [Syntrophales bacterium]|jgi:phosphopantothenoylcysteine decarboxylase/phosphopantothenate--cysteine ligase|nr:bifunctional phosphopantothenoylcysteine decarboxylase/phosphopantothenate--cysteine ligase CoaBC [Syntrophales bacterium]